MITRPTRLVAYLVPLLFIGPGVSLASSGPAVVADGIRPPSAYCLNNKNIAHGVTPITYSKVRTAQFGHCYCCGRDENGHCNHQCCN